MSNLNEGWGDDDFDLDMDLAKPALDPKSQPNQASEQTNFAQEMNFIETLANQGTQEKAKPVEEIVHETQQDQSYRVGRLFGGISNFVMSTAAAVTNTAQEQEQQLSEPKRKEFDFSDEEDDPNSQVLKHLVQENRQLKQNLNNQNQTLDLLQRQIANVENPTQNERIQELENEIRVLQKQSLGSQQTMRENFDSQAEFNEIKELLDIYKSDTKNWDVSQLYTSCFYTKDQNAILHFKSTLFQNLAQRAIINQELIVKSRHTKSQSSKVDKDNVKIFIENSRLRQENQALKGSLEQLQATLETKEKHFIDHKQRSDQKLKTQFEKSKHLQSEISVIRNEFMMLNTFASELNYNIKNSSFYSDITKVLKQHSQTFSSQLERSNNQAFEYKKQIGQMFSEQQALKKKIQELTEQVEIQKESFEKQIVAYQEDHEMNQMVREENQQLKTTVFELTSQKDEMQMDFEMEKQEAKDQVEALQTQIQGYQKLKEDFENKLENSRNKNEQLEDQIQKLRKENEESAKRQGESQGQEQRIIELNYEIEQVRASQDEQIKQLQSNIDEKMVDIQDLNDIIETKDKDLVQIEEEIDQYQQDIQDKDSQILELRNQLAVQMVDKGAGQPPQFDVSQYKLTIENLEKKIEDQKLEIQDLQDNQFDIEVFTSNKEVFKLEKVSDLKKPLVPQLNISELLLQGKQTEKNKEQQTQDKKEEPIQENQDYNDKKEQQEDKGGWGDDDEISLDIEDEKQNSNDQQKDENQENKDEGEFQRFSSAMNHGELDMIMQQVMATNQSEEEQVEEFIKQASLMKKQNRQKFDEELDQEILGDQPIIATLMEGRCDTRDRQKENNQEKEKLDEEFDQFQKQQQLEIKNAENDVNNQKDDVEESPAPTPPKSQAQKRMSRRQKSWSLPNSPINQSGDFGAKNDDEEPLHQLSPVQEENEGLRQEQQKRDTRSNTQDDMVKSKSHIQNLQKLMNSDLENVPTPRTLQRMKNEDVQDDLSLSKLAKDAFAKNDLMKNQDNDFNSSLFPDSVVDRNKGSNLFEEDEKLVGEGHDGDEGDLFSSSIKVSSQIDSSPLMENNRVQGPPEHVRSAEITEFNFDKVAQEDPSPRANISSGAHESLVKTDQEIEKDLEDKVIAVSDLDEEMQIDEEDENLNQIETIVEADEEDYDEEDSLSPVKKQSNIKTPKYKSKKFDLTKTQEVVNEGKNTEDPETKDNHTKPEHTRNKTEGQHLTIIDGSPNENESMSKPDSNIQAPSDDQPLSKIEPSQGLVDIVQYEENLENKPIQCSGSNERESRESDINENIQKLEIKERGDLSKPPETVRERISNANNLGPNVDSDRVKTSGSFKQKSDSQEFEIDFEKEQEKTTDEKEKSPFEVPPSESLEEVGEEYKDSEYYSPLKQSKADINSQSNLSDFAPSPSKLTQKLAQLQRDQQYEVLDDLLKDHVSSEAIEMIEPTFLDKKSSTQNLDQLKTSVQIDSQKNKEVSNLAQELQKDFQFAKDSGIIQNNEDHEIDVIDIEDLDTQQLTEKVEPFQQQKKHTVPPLDLSGSLKNAQLISEQTYQLQEIAPNNNNITAADFEMDIINEQDQSEQLQKEQSDKFIEEIIVDQEKESQQQQATQGADIKEQTEESKVEPVSEESVQSKKSKKNKRKKKGGKKQTNAEANDEPIQDKEKVTEIASKPVIAEEEQELEHDILETNIQQEPQQVEIEPESTTKVDQPVPETEDAKKDDLAFDELDLDLQDLDDDAWGGQSSPKLPEKQPEVTKPSEPNKVLDLFEQLSQKDQGDKKVESDPLGFFELLSGSQSKESSPEKKPKVEENKKAEESEGWGNDDIDIFQAKEQNNTKAEDGGWEQDQELDLGDLDLDAFKKIEKKDEKAEETKELDVAGDNDGWGDDDIDIL